MVFATNTSTTREYTFSDMDVNLNHEYWYWLHAIDNDGSSVFHGPEYVRVVSGESAPEIPAFSALLNTYPNPLPIGSVGNISVAVKEGETAVLRIFNIRGQIVKEFPTLSQGTHNVLWDTRDNNGREVGSGVYFYRLTGSSVDAVSRMVLIR